MRRFLKALLVLAAVLLLIALGLLRRPHGGARVDLSRQWPVMGTFLQVRALAPDSARADAALAAAQSAVFRVDSLMSTYRGESEISALNAAAGTGAWQKLASETLAVLLAARRAAEASGGAFDVTVGPLMEAWGFRTRRTGRPTEALLDSARARVDYRALEIDSAGSRARLVREGMAVDLGAIAKGYALDVAAAAMRAAGADAGMIDLGGNVYVFGAPQQRDEWKIGILDPRQTQLTLGVIALREGSVSTSGDYEQFFQYEGVRYSHIMDARTGIPARGIAQVTVSAATGLQADALSTILFVLGPDAGRRILAGPSGHGATALWVPDSAGTPVRAGRDTASFHLD